MSDYLKDSKFGQVATSLLGQQRKSKRKDFVYSLLGGFLKGQQRRLKQGLNDAIEDVNTKYNDIFVNNKEEWDGSAANRKAIAEANRIGEDTWLKKQVNQNIDIHLQDLGVSWQNRQSQEKEVQDKMFEIYNQQYQREKERLDLLRQNPVNTYDTFSKYNQAAKNEYLAALDAVQNDPTKKSLLAAAFNRIFRTEKDAEGNLTSTNAAKIELENQLNIAKEQRQEFRKGVTSADALLNDYYSSMVGKTSQELENNLVPLAKKPFTDKQILNQIKLNDTHFEDEVFMKIPLNIPVLKTGVTIENIKDIPELNEDNIEEVNIKKVWKDKKIKVYNPDTQELSTISSFKMREILARQALSLNDIKMKNGINPTVGAGIINESFQSFANEGRFLRLKELTKGGLNLGPLGIIGGETQWDADDILFIAPSQTGQNLLRNKVSASDAVAINQSQGSEDIIITDPKEIPFSSTAFIQMLEDADNIKEKEKEINELKKIYPNNSEEIDKLYNLVLKSQSSNQKTKKLDNDIKEAKTTSNKDNGEVEVDVEAKRDGIINTLGKDIFSFFKSQQGKADLNKLERYSNNNYYNTVVIKKLLKKYGLSEDASPAEVANFLDNFNSESSLLARQ
tara:strand:- start:22940 stop:24802 length:1863 start_codon:yes stop_codon:yes gene_type:complete